MSEEIENIKRKYIKQADPKRVLYKEPLKQNLQSDIEKIESIIRKISSKQATSGELNRLRTSVIKLLSVIDNNEMYHM